MKKFLYLLSLVLLGQITYAQTADEIIDKYLEVCGGKDKLKSIQTVSMEGVLKAGDQQFPIKIAGENNKFFRFDMNIMGMSCWVLQRKDSGWVFMPIQGQTAPEAMAQDDIKEGADDLDFQGSLCDYKEKGHKVEYIGMDDVDGTDCHKLKLTAKNGKVTYYFIDPNSHFVVRELSVKKAGGKEMEVTKDLSNYKTTGDGYMFPFTQNSQFGSIEFNNIIVNKELASDASIPKMK